MSSVVATGTLPEAGVRSTAPSWSALRWFSFYRVVISGLFGLLASTGKMPPNVGGSEARGFTIIAVTYAVAAIVALVVSEQRMIDYRLQVYSLSLLDIVAIILLMHFAGGVTSGLGVLLVVALAGTCLLASGRAGIFFAALTSIAFLVETVFGTLYLGYGGANYTQAGLLGAACFGTAILASILAERARQSEVLAAARAVDIANLSTLNEHIVQRMRVGIMVLDEDARIVLMNDAAREILGFEGNYRGATVNAVSTELESHFLSWLDTGENPESTITGRGSINALVSFSDFRTGSSAARGGALVFLEDAAQTRQRAQQLKLASLGKLTASIAHEIRNPLGAISHAGQLLSEAEGLADEDLRMIDIMLDHTRRVNTIIENILTLGRRKEVVPESFELAPWLEGFVAELKERFTLADTDITQVWHDDDIVIRMDKSQLHQVLWNLCENGLRYARQRPRLVFESGINSGNGRPYLDIVDSGPGLDAAIADRLFEPFATSEAQGTGLGLYIARELCEANQAALQLVGREPGCRFRLLFAHPDRQQRIGDL